MKKRTIKQKIYANVLTNKKLIPYILFFSLCGLAYLQVNEYIFFLVALLYLKYKR